MTAPSSTNALANKGILMAAKSDFQAVNRGRAGKPAWEVTCRGTTVEYCWSEAEAKNRVRWLRRYDRESPGEAQVVLLAKPKTRLEAMKFAASHGCVLEANYFDVNGWDLTLHAPDGKVFKGVGASVSCDLAGVGVLRKEMNWRMTIDSIAATVAEGFEDEEGEGE